MTRPLRLQHLQSHFPARCACACSSVDGNLAKGLVRKCAAMQHTRSPGLVQCQRIPSRHLKQKVQSLTIHGQPLHLELEGPPCKSALPPSNGATAHKRSWPHCTGSAVSQDSHWPAATAPKAAAAALYTAQTPACEGSRHEAPGASESRKSTFSDFQNLFSHPCSRRHAPCQ